MTSNFFTETIRKEELKHIIDSDYLNWISSLYSPPLWAVLIAGFFVVINLTLSVYLLFEHLSAYKNPEEQNFLIGVILMVPCYAVESFVSLINPAISLDIEILRDCYESFAMYCFGRYLVSCLGGGERTIAFLKREGRTSAKTPLLDHGSERGIVKHHLPMNLILKPWKLGQWVYQVIKFGIVQYISSPLLSKPFSICYIQLLSNFSSCEMNHINFHDR
ncbi:Transmembrane protein 184 homolog DDB_G0284525 [Olea europaea subsp. europaea]|uniref:Transmembrane protein 184 homolog DDB_G0284525 n=1 Tax=Olea europaea subsp. europaea TaxID=158383 RepID=A0A8S0V0W0_OLEEU|nr:Transmembrane protein 184 homolog DDB_G0284525 [Olea europaea subsp. europaea]